MNTINSITDAEIFVANSGVSEWEFGGNASAEGFAEWVFRNRSAVDSNEYHAEISEYLISVGENPSDY